MADTELSSNPRPRKKRSKPKKLNDEDADLGTDEYLGSSNTQLRVDQILQQVVAKSTKDAVDQKKKRKKKPKNNEEEHVLESLRKGEGIDGLHKDQDSALLANIYDSDDFSKSEKSNKLRQKRNKNKNNNSNNNEDNKLNTEENVPDETVQKKKKKPKKKTRIHRR